MAEEGTKNEGVSDAEKLCNVMDSISAKMDAIMDKQARMDARMDSMEMDRKRKDAEEEEGDKREEADGKRKDADGKRKDAEGEESFKKWAKEEGEEPEHKTDKRKDSRRRDAEEGELEEKGEPKEPVADKRRKDARKDESEEEKEEKEEAREDKRRKDAEEEKEKEEEGAKADAALRGEMSDLREQIAALQARAPALLSDADRERFASIQERADPAFQAFGDRAPGPLDGETPVQYKRRLGSKLQGHSPKWKDARLSAIADDAVLDAVVGDIFADSITAATRGADVPAGQLHARTTRSDAGHTYIDYVGDPRAMSRQFAGRAQRAGQAKH